MIPVSVTGAPLPPFFPPVVSFTANVTSGYSPLTVQFTDTSTESPTSWYWTFGDGTNSTLQNPTHTYVANGISSLSGYQVRLWVTYNSSSYQYTSNPTSNFIKVYYPSPKANFSSSVTSGFAPLTVQFTDKSIGDKYPPDIPMRSWLWDFGDNDTGNYYRINNSFIGNPNGYQYVQNPVHIYFKPGSYSVTLKFSGPGGTDTLIRRGYITVDQGMGSISVTSDPTGAKIYLDGNDTGFVTPKTLSNVTTGNHVISCNLTGYSESFAPEVVVSTGQTSTVYRYLFGPPRVNFSVSNISGSNPLTVQFTDKSIGHPFPPIGWQWDFGDGSTSTMQNPSKSFEQNPRHTYLKADTYLVTLLVGSQNGQSGLSRNITVPVNASATGSISIQSTPTGAKIYLDGSDTGFITPKILTNLSSGNHLVKCRLSGYTDNSQTVSVAAGQTTTLIINLVSIPTTTGSISIQSNPTGAKIYLDYTDTGFVTPQTLPNQATGSHIIRCSLSGYDDTSQTVSVISGQRSDVMITLQKSGNVAPKADFSASAREGGSPLPVQFTDKSTNSPTSWAWTFGDGSTSTEQNPAHTYEKSGMYSVKLKVSNPTGSNGLSRSGYIVVSGSASTTGSISIQSNPTGAKIYLDDADTGFVTPKTISNVPAGSHLIRCSLSGYSDNSQTVSMSEGQTATVSIDLVSAPQTTGSISIQSNPTGAKIYLDYADTGFVTPKTISNVTVGGHVIRCRFSGYDDNSQTVSVSEGQTAIVSIDLVSAPQTTGSISIQSNPTGAKIYLDDTGTGFVTPKTISNVPVGSHVIRCSLSGYSDNSQTVSVSEGQTADVIITLQKSGNIAPKADLSASAREGGSPLTVQFTDKSTNSPTSWSWTFGDGSTSNEQNPTHTYLKAGMYSVKLKVSNQAGSNGLSRSGYIVVSGSSPTTGSISIQSNPTGATIYLDGADTGFVTPKTLTNVLTGNHVVLCRLNGYTDTSKTTTISAGQTATVSIDLVSIPTTGAISVQSNPSGAKIYLDGVDTGFVTPKTISNVPAGSHVIRCSLIGYDDTAQTVSISSGQTTNVIITLQKSGNVTPEAGNIEKSILKYVNQERVNRGLSALNWNDKAALVARTHTQLMISSGISTGQDAHQLPGEPELGMRLLNGGIQWTTGAGETIAFGWNGNDSDTIAKNIVHAWLWDDGPEWGHRHIILDGITSDPGYNPAGVENIGLNQAGVGVVYGTVNIEGNRFTGWQTTMNFVGI